MGERTRFEEAVERTRRAHPAATVGGGAALALALFEGIPLLTGYFQAKDAIVVDAHTSHIATLGTQLEECQAERQAAERRLREVLSGIADVPVSAAAPMDLPAVAAPPPQP